MKHRRKGEMESACDRRLKQELPCKIVKMEAGGRQNCCSVFDGRERRWFQYRVAARMSWLSVVASMIN
jgi:hypothetical protein